jgi:hypothetical protein
MHKVTVTSNEGVPQDIFWHSVQHRWLGRGRSASDLSALRQALCTKLSQSSEIQIYLKQASNLPALRQALKLKLSLPSEIKKNIQNRLPI